MTRCLAGAHDDARSCRARSPRRRRRRPRSPGRRGHRRPGRRARRLGLDPYERGRGCRACRPTPRSPAGRDDAGRPDGSAIAGAVLACEPQPDRDDAVERRAADPQAPRAGAAALGKRCRPAGGRARCGRSRGRSWRAGRAGCEAPTRGRRRARRRSAARRRGSVCGARVPGDARVGSAPPSSSSACSPRRRRHAAAPAPAAEHDGRDGGEREHRERGERPGPRRAAPAASRAAAGSARTVGAWSRRRRGLGVVAPARRAPRRHRALARAAPARGRRPRAPRGRGRRPTGSGRPGPSPAPARRRRRAPAATSGALAPRRGGGVVQVRPERRLVGLAPVRRARR